MFAARSRLSSSRIRVPLSAGLGTLLLAAAVSLTGITSAQADATNGTSLGTVTVDPSTGTWVDNPAAVMMGGDYICPAMAGMTDPGASLYIAERGHEAPLVSTAGSVPETTDLYPYNGADSGVVTDQTGAAFPTTGQFPLVFDGYVVWRPAAGSFATLQDFLNSLDSSKQYSLVAACAYYVTVSRERRIMPDATGHVFAAWSPLTLTADKTGWTVGTVKAGTTVALSAAPGAGSATLTATVQSAGSTASAATGSVTFDESGSTASTAAVSNGVATTTVTGLAAGQTHTYTATYVPAADAAFTGSTSTGASVTIPTSTPVAGTELASGDAVVAGTKYKLTTAAGSLTAGDTVSAEIHSNPIALPETSTVQPDGSTVYGFTAPSGLPSGTHQLVLADTHSKTVTLDFTVAAVNGSNGNGGNGNIDLAANGTNSPVSFATDWIGGMAFTPMGTAGLFGFLLLGGALLVGGWFYFWRRRGLPTVEVTSDADGSIRS